MDTKSLKNVGQRFRPDEKQKLEMDVDMGTP